MYLPAQYAETDPAVLRQIIRNYPLGTIFVSDSSGLSANHIPLLLHDTPAPHGELIGHLALANHLAQQAAGDGIDCLVVFQGPQRYISAGWYASRETDHRVAPTWDYEVVHVQGRARAVSDPQWILGAISELAAIHEAAEQRPWSVGEAPQSFIDELMKHVAGLRIEITGMVGKSKIEQTKSAENQGTVMAALQKHTDGTSQELLEAMRRHCRPS